jgi:hypothetical protein
MRIIRSGICAALLFLPAFAGAQTMVPWLTRAHDNQRTGWNSQETVLTQSNIKQKGLVIKEIIPVFGDSRGVEAQPLIVPEVATKGGTQDVMILCSMANQCRGVNAETGADIWDVTLSCSAKCPPVLGSIPFDANGDTIDAYQINQHWGALATGVVDPNDNRFYQVFWASPDGSASPSTARYYMAVLNVADGSQVVAPVLIDGSSQGYDFNAEMRKARSSAVLLDQNGTRTVLECTGTVLETAPGSAGFCFAFDTFTNSITTMLATTAGEGAGIWQAGQGLACDLTSTYCYAETGNGDFDGLTQWGESLIQLQYTPPTATTAAVMAIPKGWAPWTDFQRAGQAQVPEGKIAGESMPSESVHQPVGGGMNMPLKNATTMASIGNRGSFVTAVYPAMAQGAWTDQDLGSAGPGCIFQIGYCIVSGKDGAAYSIPVPGFTGTTSATVGTLANCEYAQAVWMTFDGAGSPCVANLQSLNYFPNGYTAHQHATPVQFLNPLTNSYEIAAGGENNQVHDWSVSSTGAMTYVGQGNEFASSDLRGKTPGGMAGSFCSGSSNGTNADTYLLVCVQPYGDVNKTITPGHLIVYDPVHITNGVMPTLWDSGDWGAHNAASQWSCMADKFLPAYIDGGEIIESCYDGRIMILTLGN